MEKKLYSEPHSFKAAAWCIRGPLCYSYWIKTGGGVAINCYSNYTDVSRTQQEWGRGRHRERVKVRERERDASYKAKSCLFGKNLWAVRPGFGSETGARWANDCLHNSPKWCFSVAGRRLLKLLFLQIYSPSCVVRACVWQQSRHVDERLRLRAPNSSLHGSIRLQSQLKR